MSGENQFLSVDDSVLFTWCKGAAYFRGLRVEHRTVDVAGRSYVIAGVEDAADLLDDPTYAKRFIEDDIAPYGVELWPAAIMLAEYIAGDDRSGCHAIELGCGLGLVSIVAAANGWRVVATDNEETSLQFTRYNVAANDVAVEACELLDWRRPPAGRRYQRVLCADVLYQLVDHAPLLKCIAQLLEPAGAALVADPNRGVADRFASMAASEGFAVDVIASKAPGPNGKLVSGRIFVLRRAT